VHEAANLNEAIDALTQAGGQWVTVTDDQRRVTGVLTAGAVVRSYRDAVQEATTPVSPPSEEALRRLARDGGAVP
jgi:DNA/RNA-binding domain of Phe-tRNA-synthetase-like protein